MTRFLCIPLMAALLVACRSTDDDALHVAQFEFVMDITNTAVDLHSLEGCSWTDASVGCEERPCRFVVSEAGIGESTMGGGFEVMVEVADSEVRFTAVRGCAWTEASVSCRVPCRVTVDQSGVAGG